MQVLVGGSLAGSLAVPPGSRLQRRLCVCSAQPDRTPSLKDVMQQFQGLVAPKQQERPAPSKANSKPAGSKSSSKAKDVRQSANGTKTSGSKQAGTSSSKGANPNPKAAGQRSQSSSTGVKQKSSRASSSTASTKPSKPKPSQPQAKPLLLSNAKGFGSLPSSSGSSSRAAADVAAPGSSRVLKIFRFGVEAAAVERAVNACGWQQRVLQVDGIGQADILLAVKNTAGGKHQNLSQGERAAANAGIPFVVVGRRMSKESLQKALGPFLQQQTPQEAAAAAKQAQQEAANKAAADAWFASASANWGKGVSPSSSSSAAAAAKLGPVQQQQQQKVVSSQLLQSSRGRGPSASSGSRG